MFCGQLYSTKEKTQANRLNFKKKNTTNRLVNKQANRLKQTDSETIKQTNEKADLIYV